MIVAHNLSKSYGEHHALNNLNLNIAPGEIFCLLGQNGAGKTTTINCFLGFTAPSAGKAEINGIDVANDPQGSKRHLAYLPEVVMLYLRLAYTKVEMEGLIRIIRSLPSGTLWAATLGIWGLIKKTSESTYATLISPIKP